MGIQLIKIAAVYFFIGILLGMYMSINHTYNYSSIHAHVNLLGWASLGLAGVIYHLFPAAGESIFGKVHFWLHNIGLPLMMTGLFLLVHGYEAVEPVIAAGGILVTLGVLSFLYTVFTNIGTRHDK
ncbi:MULTISPECIES: cytochrome-c oxidase [Paenibacillus]|uniref:Cytochrome-c oxidase n=1 Tax=Paenibacillus campinasensis TaxID=66347 RepID=A0A268EQK1_9BACL|nr:MULTISPECIES: cytochrome-c oxidase [Paenibacillus]MUG65390.1 cytochrome-c oxidase [Paenibacillus campinasensis]PAD75405.1 cytochrome-c oxidase [Paenibacillus campinasensis]PAK49572.1 cytochrome-c oxidase [Paenibacillus sp. 7541]